MEETRKKLLEKHQKKVDKLIEELKLLKDAQSHVMVNSGTDIGVVGQLGITIDHLSQASYSLLLGIASAEGGEIIGQMKVNLDQFQEAAQ